MVLQIIFQVFFNFIFGNISIVPHYLGAFKELNYAHI